MKQKIISSMELADNRITELGAQNGVLEIYDGLSTPFSEDVIVLSEQHVQTLSEFAIQATQNYGPDNIQGLRQPEATFVQQNFGVHTLLGRIDCAVKTDNGELAIYEMEDSPSGTGITDVIHRAAGGEGIVERLHEHYHSTLGQIPTVLVSGMRSHGTDDAITVGADKYFYQAGINMPPKDLSDNALVIIKAIPGVPESASGYLDLQDRSVCTLVSEGDKTYGQRLGLFKTLGSQNDLLVDWEGDLRSQAVKRAIGSMAMGVKIFLQKADRQLFSSAGTVTASKLRSTATEYISRDGRAFAQEFASPNRIDNPEGCKNMILRIYTLIKPPINGGAPGAEIIGGCYVARPELIVHGASNAVSGAVVIK